MRHLPHVDVKRLETAFHVLQKDGAPGIDGVTWERYAEDAEAHPSVTREHLG